MYISNDRFRRNFRSLWWALFPTVLVGGVNYAQATQQFYFSSQGHTYIVTSTALSGSGFAFSGHWMYQPSVIRPSGLTNNQYVMLFNSNRIAGQSITGGEAIFYTTSSNGYSGWATPTPVLTNSTVDNICDMADARPIWDGSQWRVFVQAVEGNYPTGQCGTTNHVFMAHGATLTQLQWVKVPGTNSARRVGQGTGAGIGEPQQWFYTPPYGGSPQWPFQIIYNNWGAAPPDHVNLFSYLYSPDFGMAGYWYGPVYAARNGEPWFFDTYYYPDAILIGSAVGYPGIGFESNCQLSDHRYQYQFGIGYYPNPLSNTAQWGSPFPGTLESTSSDGNGPRMFRPRMARNEHGFIPLYSSSPRTWKTFVYYNDAQIENNSTSPCSGYSRWNTSDQRFSVTELTIVEQ